MTSVYIHCVVPAPSAGLLLCVLGISRGPLRTRPTVVLGGVANTTVVHCDIVLHEKLLVSVRSPELGTLQAAGNSQLDVAVVDMKVHHISFFFILCL